jgi:C1A family cysteine protease
VRAFFGNERKGEIMSRRICVKVAIFAVSVVLLLAYGSLSTANAGLTPEQARELGEIQKAIKAKGARWKASETSVSRLSREERKGLCGLRFTERPNMETGSAMTSAESTATVYDSSFDWRDYEVVTGVKNQGGCGSCWAFSAVGAMESALLINDNTPGIDLDLSEQFVVSCDNDNYGCCGGYMYRVYDFLTNSGTIYESCFPYNSSGTCKCNRFFCRNITSACDNMCADWESRHKRISGWEPVSYDVDAIKSALLDGPVPCGMDVYTDFFYYTGDVYQYTWGDYEGGHAVIIIGWNNADGCWIVKNSWGTDWGENGYFKIKYNNCSIGVDAGMLHYTPCNDQDDDGYQDIACGGNDCDDDDPSINPGATEVCGDSVDNNCDGAVDEGCSMCSAKGNPCVDNSDCCSGKCLGKHGKKRCK